MFQGCPQNRVMLKRVCFNSLIPSEKWGYVKEACVFKKTQRHVFQACLKNVAVLKRHMFQVQKNGTWLKKTAMTAVSFCFK